MIICLTGKRRILFIGIVCLCLLITFLFGFFISNTINFGKLPPSSEFSIPYKELQVKYMQLVNDTYKVEADLATTTELSQNLKIKLKESVSSITLLKSELSFYKGLFAESSNKKGVTFKAIKLLEVTDPRFHKYTDYNVYQFFIILANKSKTLRYRRGKIEFSFVDNNNETIENYKLFDQKHHSQEKQKIRFQYFTKVEGFILLDKSINLSKVSFNYKDNLNSSLSIVKMLDWQQSKGINYVGK